MNSDGWCGIIHLSLEKELIEMYYVGFLDILGFKKIVCEKEENEVLNIFKQIEVIIEDLKKTFEVAPFFYRIMSDSIVIACNEKIPSSLPIILWCCGKTQELLLEKGILLRGGVSYGKFYYDDTIMYGKGLVSAYELENNISRYPRVVVDTKAIIKYKSKMKNTEVYSEATKILEIDTESIYYVDIALMYLANASEETLPYRMKSLKGLIEKSLIDPMLSANVREKYVWLKNEFNEFIERNQQFKDHRIEIKVL